MSFDVPAVPVPPQELLRMRVSDPYPYFAWLRAHSPVYAERKADGRCVWHISRYEDVAALLADARLSKQPALVPGYVPGPAGLNRHLVHADPPDHTRLRRLLSKSFGPRRIAHLAPVIESAAHRLLDQVEGSVHIDVIADFAAPLTFRLICTILGVPDHLDTPATRDTLMATLLPAQYRPQAPSPAAGPAAADGLHALLVTLVALKRTAGPSDDADLLAALVQACDETGDMSEEELLSTAYLLLLVGHDTTMNLIGNGTLALLSHPEQKARWEQEPSLSPTAVEELLRYDSPVRDATFRAAAAPIEILGHTIGRGDIVNLLIGSANRDPAAFHDPDRLDVARAPNDHLAFGYGPHFCIGAALARLEGTLALPLLLRRLGPVRLAKPAAELQWRPARVMRGLTQLPLQRI
ncbi:cytochrome P450 [Streptomyces sp. NPDC001513]|uniref:cytochrome P450 n=1 Tax=Streptomyces sp. NPDC001513 TaxID=3364580 RepID=UPI0036C10F6B